MEHIRSYKRRILCYSGNGVQLHRRGKNPAPVVIGVIPGELGSSRGGKESGNGIPCSLFMTLYYSSPSFPVKGYRFSTVEG